MFPANIPITPSQSKFATQKNPPDDIPGKSDEISENHKNADETTHNAKRCSLCHKAVNGYQLELHNLFSCSHRHFQCTRCEMRFLNNFDLERHFDTHKTSKYFCGFDGCNANFSRLKYLHEHQRMKGHLSQNSIREKKTSESSDDWIASSDDVSSDDSEQIIYCELCNNIYQSYQSLKRHKKINHNILVPKLSQAQVEAYFSLKRVHACLLCDLRFNHFRTLQFHIEKHDKYKFECQICGFKYQQQEILNEHQRRAHQSKAISSSSTTQDVQAYFSPNRNFSCTLCDLRFNHSCTLQKHVKNHDGYKFECQACGNKYTRKIILLYHQMRAHGRLQNTASSSQQSASSTHCDKMPNLQKNHANIFRCRTCWKKFPLRFLLNNHIKKVHNRLINPDHWLNNIPRLFSLKRPLACDQCDLRFEYENVLKSHKLGHFRFQYECDVDGCGLRYWNDLILNEHQKRAHGLGTSSVNDEMEQSIDENVNEITQQSIKNIKENPKKQLNCSKCEATFTHRKHLNAHLKEIHDTFDEKWQSEIPKKFSLKKPFACSKCDLRFMKENVLNKHLKGHQSFKFQCNAEGCRMKYRHGEVLREHQKRAHQLIECEMKFDDKNFLKEPHEIAQSEYETTENKKKTELVISTSKTGDEVSKIVTINAFTNETLDDNQDIAIRDNEEEDDFIQELLGHLLDDEAPEILSENGIKQEKIQDVPNLIKTTESNQIASVDYSQKYHDENTPNDLTREPQKDEYSSYDKILHEKLANIKTEVQSSSNEKVQPAVGTWICLECAANYSKEDQLWSHMRQNNHL